jgi:uncharacterized membrane protein YcaP (DUF421 family)
VLFESADSLLPSVLVAVVAYVALIVVVRTAGKRTLAKLNAFDFLVTVAFGSILASAMVDDSVSATEAALAFVILAGLQATVAALSSRWRGMRSVVTARPVALVVDGVVRHDALRHVRVAIDDVREVVRGSGIADLGEIRAVVLESNGTLSVIRSRSEREWALEDVVGLGPDG